jgi:hypothetical protein
MVAMAALHLLSEVAETTPLYIAVDDVHWLDHQTQEAITFISRRIDREPIVVVGVVRTGHGGPFAAAGFVRVGGADPDDARRHSPTLRPLVGAASHCGSSAQGKTKFRSTLGSGRGELADR